jgi:hypothetical protein
MLQELPDWIQESALKGDDVYSIASALLIEVINYMQIVATLSSFYNVSWPSALVEAGLLQARDGGRSHGTPTACAVCPLFEVSTAPS